MLEVRLANLVQYAGARGTIRTQDRRTVHVATHAGVHEAGNKAPDGLQTREVDCAGEADTTGASVEHFAALAAGERPDRAPQACTFAEGADALAVGSTFALLEAG